MTCSVEGCEREGRVRGLCRMHYQRARRSGELTRHPDVDTYHAVHKRLAGYRGSAAKHPCEAPGCERQAATWAWQRTGPSLSGKLGEAHVTWGTDIEDYAPMCSHHSKLMDMGGTLTHCPNGHERAIEGTGAYGHCLGCVRARSRAWREKQKR